MSQMILSLFPGIGLLDRAFEEVFGGEACLFRGPDCLWGGDMRTWHPPAGKFDGVIGGPPCQCFSRLAHMVRQNGYTPRFGNLIPDFERCCRETAPAWWLMEEVPDAPLPVVCGYSAWSCLLNNRQLGETQNRTRRWTFGVRGPKYRALNIETAALESIEFEYAATGGSSRPIAIGGSGRPKKFKDGKGRMPWNAKSKEAFAEICRKQGLPPDFDLPPFTVAAKCQAVGNGVPMAMGRALARAVKEAIMEKDR